MSVIEVKNLKKYFGKTHAVDGVSFSIEKGEIFGFLGPNGAGKTTTIRCLMNFLKPAEGQISILGKDSVKDSEFLKSKIGYLSGSVRLYDSWTGHDHISFIEAIRGKSKIVSDLIKKLDFDPKIKFKQLSTGNRQKLGLILALMSEPEILIMDEPTVGLDPLLQGTIYTVLENLNKKGTTIFMSSHNLSEVERLCSRVGIIKNGKIVALENIENLGKKRMHAVEIHFVGSFNKDNFRSEHIEVVQELPDGLILNVRGDINQLIDRLKSYPLKDLEITHASLEEVFLEFYEDSRSGSQSAVVLTKAGQGRER